MKNRLFCGRIESQPAVFELLHQSDDSLKMQRCVVKNEFGISKRTAC
jgi:hypothetical protein